MLHVSENEFSGAVAHLKVCAGCSSILPLTAFPKKSSAKDGRGSRCVPCNRKYLADWHRKHPEQSRKIKEQWRQKNPAYAQEWQSQNMAAHVKANAAYRDRNILAEKPPETSIKTCRACLESKELREFYVNSNKKDGRSPDCARCEIQHKRTRFYKVSRSQFDAMWTDQNGQCAICKDGMKPYGKGGCVVDHDHKTGRVRSLLCTQCNLGIGHMKDSPDRCDKAASYLRQHEQTA